MQFHYFVLPFAIGFFGLLGILAVRIFGWAKAFDKDDRRQVAKNILSTKSLVALWEIVSESLLHRKIFKTNPLLGWMHMTFALGWFLLILVGKIQTTVHTGDWSNPVWYAIFFRFFEPVHASGIANTILAVLMDGILLFLLSGVALAMFKRLRSSAMGMQKTTRHSLVDRMGIAVIWCIFPMRLLAESITSGVNGGGSFLTGTLGQALAGIPGLQYMYLPAWWAYSITLGIFFAVLPFTRYMHIPAEMVLILFRKWGVKSQNMVALQTEACSRCGICVDGCAVLAANMKSQAVYTLRGLRAGRPDAVLAQSCMDCGSCQSRCPVGIDLVTVRAGMKRAVAPHLGHTANVAAAAVPSAHKVVYFPGCIGKLTPSVTKAMGQLFETVKADWKMLEPQELDCCGRPMLLAGNEIGANNKIAANVSKINAMGADVLVTSCPVCYKMFTQHYNLEVKVLHHTEWIEQMMAQKKIVVSHSDISTVYHDPCELGRGSAIYDQPRSVLNAVVNLGEAPLTRERSFCCGGSLSGYVVDDAQRGAIAKQALENLTARNPQQVVTACPMCKKSLGRYSNVPVRDIAEVVQQALAGNNATAKAKMVREPQLASVID